MSPLIFILCFDPILKELDLNSNHGYEINGQKIISAPFADDFCLISNNKMTHQRLISKISKLTKTMGLKLKPVKCRSLSISSGKPTAVKFNLDDSIIPTLDEESHKFLGSLVTFKNTNLDVFQYLEKKLRSGLENIEKGLIRNEFKLKVYAEYFLPSIRFHLTVNDTSMSHLQQLDALTDRYLKLWSGIPRPGTLAFLHTPRGLNIKSISSLYEECHTNAYISSRVKADDKVNKCLDSQLNRESNWTKKVSQVVKSDQVLEAVNQEIPDANLKQKQTKAKEIHQEQSTEKWHSHIKTLVVQGRFLDLLHEESKSFQWNSIIYNLPNRVSKFLINSVTDTLNTRANLQRWGKAMSSHCKACGNHETLHHVLNHCPEFLKQGRYTWRHNNVLSYINNLLKTSIVEDEVLKCDLGDGCGFTTVPINCTVTNLIPDICLYSEKEKLITIIELTIPFELNIDSAHSRKSDKYAALVSDINANGIKTEFIALEIGSRGFISCDNDKRLRKLFNRCKSDISYKNFKLNISKLAIISSFVIYHAKNDPMWENIPLLSVPYGN